MSDYQEYISYDRANEAGDPTRYVMTRRAVLLTMANYAKQRGFCYTHAEYAIYDFMQGCNAWYSDRNGERREFNQ